MHHQVVWVQADAPTNYSEVEDPLLALLARARLARPRNREQGEYLPPKDDPEQHEPHRTEFALSKAFSCGVDIPIGALIGRSHQWRQRRSQWQQRQRKRRQQKYAAGYAIERLPAWIDGSSGTQIGIGYLAVQLVLQMLMSLVVGFLFVHPFALTSPGQMLLLVFSIILTLALACFTGCRTANDYWDGIVTASCYLLEALALCLTFASVHVRGSEMPAELEDPEHIARVTKALVLTSYAASTLTCASCLPLVLTGYNILVVPVVAKIRTSNSGCNLCDALIIVITTPLLVISALFGINRDFVTMVDMVDVNSGAVADVWQCKPSVSNLVAPVEDSEKVKEDVVAQGFDGLMMGQRLGIDALPDEVDDRIVDLLAAPDDGVQPDQPLHQPVLTDFHEEPFAVDKLEGPTPQPVHMVRTSSYGLPEGCDVLDIADRSLASHRHLGVLVPEPLRRPLPGPAPLLPTGKASSEAEAAARFKQQWALLRSSNGNTVLKQRTIIHVAPPRVSPHPSPAGSSGDGEAPKNQLLAATESSMTDGPTPQSAASAASSDRGAHTAL